MTVNYVCPGMGRGRTILRVETPRLVQIDSQGLHNGAPFALRAQAPQDRALLTGADGPGLTGLFTIALLEGVRAFPLGTLSSLQASRA